MLVYLGTNQAIIIRNFQNPTFPFPMNELEINQGQEMTAFQSNRQL